MYVHVESDGFIKRSSKGLTTAYSTPNLHAVNAPLTGRSMISADDDYQDVSENVLYSRSLNLLDTIAETHIAMNLFFNNNFRLAEERMEVLADKSMYHALGHGSILFLKAMMTCDRSDLEKAIEATGNATKVIEKFRARYTLYESIYRIGGSQVKTLTDHEIHAELCYAESLLFRAILTFFYDETLTSFIRGALRIRSCFQSFRECQRILNCHSWDDRDLGIKAQFEAGTRTANGIFNLMLSTLPSKVMRLLEVVGFSGNKAMGMQELHHASAMVNTLRMVMSRLALLAWHLFITYFVGAGQPDLPLCKRLLKPLIRDYPNFVEILITPFISTTNQLIHKPFTNSFTIFGRILPSLATSSFDAESGNVDIRFALNEPILSIYSAGRQTTIIPHISYWELLFTNCYLRKWSRAANYAKKLLDENKWSKCVYTYLLAGLINADLSAPKRLETVKVLLERVPLCRLRIAGKSIPVEKFCERKAKRFLENNRLYYAHYASFEFMYFWMGFQVVESKPEIFVAPILEDIENYWNKYASDDINDICVYEFLRGVCLKILKEFENAEWCFMKVISNELKLTDYFYLAPNAVFELAQLRIQQKRTKEAHALLLKARGYQKYSLENKLHFRIHSAMESLNVL
ncbi:hypothetical protein M3Y97_00594400 [Aphelenchoides bicaudatus]|nr:hypothetical protein M3Y97_00594400 [Aphelenchoides bicaudatus]